MDIIMVALVIFLMGGLAVILTGRANALVIMVWVPAAGIALLFVAGSLLLRLPLTELGGPSPQPNRYQVLTVVTVALGPSMALAQNSTTQRPISDFTSTQGTWCGPLPSAACPNFVSTYVGWSGQSSSATTRLATVDFAAKEPVAGLLNTSTGGTITERRLPDGRAELHIVLHTRGALTQVWACDSLTCPPAVPSGAPWFGHTATEVLGGKAPGVADSTLDVTLINSAPGAPIPDLVRYVMGDLPITDLVRVAFRASATGPLRAGFGVPDLTPGRVQITQNGLIGTAFRNGFRGGQGGQGLADGFPAEHINLQVAGR